MNKLICYLLLFLTFSSCSLWLDQVTKKEEKYSDQIVEQTHKENYQTCQKEDTKLQILSENKKNNIVFNKFIRRFQKKEKRKNFIHYAVLWSLVQMRIRPDLSSPTARLQFIIKSKGKTQYYNLFSKEKRSTPYLRGLNLLLKKYRSSYSLIELAQIIDRTYPNQYYVSKDFSAFLKKNKKRLKNSKFGSSFLKGDEVLQKDERVVGPPIWRFIRRALKQRNTTIQTTSLFEFKKNKNFSVRCNYDLSFYEDGNYLINKNKIQSNTFGISDSKNSFFATSTQDLKEMETIPSSIFFSGSSSSRTSTICLLKKSTGPNYNLWLISGNSRDPGQHIHHLLDYNLDEATSVKEVSRLIGFSRHLFLKDPVRLILESHRSTQEQLKEILKLTTPIYHAKALGRIWGHYQSPSEKTFILDDRLPGDLLCSPK